MKSALKDLDDRTKSRRRRVLSDQYDRVLLDLTGYYRDVLVVQSGANVELVNEELRESIERVASVDDDQQPCEELSQLLKREIRLLQTLIH